jgi:hypothetical protein
MAIVRKEQVFSMSTEEWHNWVKGFSILEGIHSEVLYIECKRCGASKIKNTKCDYCGQ